MLFDSILNLSEGGAKCPLSPREIKEKIEQGRSIPFQGWDGHGWLLKGDNHMEGMRSWQDAVYFSLMEG